MKSIIKTSVRTDPPRAGAAMVLGLILLLVASLMIAALMRTAAMSHRQLKRDEFRLQASLLADAGCDRALAMLQSRPELTSDEWVVPAEQLAPDRTAIVHLSVAPDSLNPNQRIVTSVAEFPVGHPDLVRITRQRRIQ